MAKLLCCQTDKCKVFWLKAFTHTTQKVSLNQSAFIAKESSPESLEMRLNQTNWLANLSRTTRARRAGRQRWGKKQTGNAFFSSSQLLVAQKMTMYSALVCLPCDKEKNFLYSNLFFKLNPFLRKQITLYGFLPCGEPFQYDYNIFREAIGSLNQQLLTSRFIDSLTIVNLSNAMCENVVICT